jgi:hypothetical protein
MEHQFNTVTRGAKHGVPDKEADVEKLTVQYTKSELHVHKPGRRIRNATDRAPDVITTGAINLERLHTIDKWFEGRSHERSTAEEWDDDEGSSAS